MKIFIAQSKLRVEYISAFQEAFVIAANSEFMANHALNLSPYFCPEPEFKLVPMAYHDGLIACVLCKTKG